MSANLEFRYLDITWSDPDTVLKLECSSDPVEIVEEDGCRRLETTTFRQYQPWLGLRIIEPLEHAPYFSLEGTDRAELLRVKDPATQIIWWVYSTSWDSERNRHLSEMYRTAGTAHLVAQGKKYEIVVNTLNFTVDELEYYLRDFKNELWTLILNDRSALKGRVERETPDIYSDELLSCLKDFVEALESIVDNPGVELKEVQTSVPTRSVRPVNRTFMELATKGPTRLLTGRAFKESFNTPNNQYVHYCLSRVLYLVAKVRDIGMARIIAFEHAKHGESSCMEKLQNTTFRKVDSVVFENEIKDIETKIQKVESEQTSALESAISNQRVCHDGEKLPIGSCTFVLGSTFAHSDSEFFCNTINDVDYKEKYGRERYLTLKLPTSFFGFSESFPPYTYKFRARGFFKRYQKEQHETLEYVRVEEISVISSQLIVERDRLIRQRKIHLKNDWKVPLRSSERIEVLDELNTVKEKIKLYDKQMSSLRDFLFKMAPLAKRLIALRYFFQNHFIGTRQTFPNSMAFVQNPDYSMSRASFRKIMAIPGMDASLFDLMMVIEQLGLVNVADLYEKWCLLKILKVLTDVFGFIIHDDWKTSLVAGVKSNRYDLAFDLDCKSRKQWVRLTYQKQFDSGKRPDFVLDFSEEGFSRDAHHQPGESQRYGRLVLDAKFRDVLNDESLADLVRKMSLVKNYSEDGKNQVFILHPCRNPIYKRTSPLEWGPHSDYGQTAGHRSGCIYLAPTLESRSSLDNLQRLIGMILQSAGSYCRVYKDDTDDKKYELNLTCIGCGNHDMDGFKVTISKTERGHLRLVVECIACKLRSIGTVCLKCKAILFKNGYYWTYHRTRAEQISNVVCPMCSTFLDNSSSAR